MTAELKKILVVDDEASMRHMLQLVLEKEGYQVAETANGGAALELLQEESFDVVLCDIRMPGMDGLTFLQEAARCKAAPTIIMMSAFGSIDTAIECMKRGAYDYVSKPFKPDEVVLTLKKAEERFRLRQENLRLREELARSGARSGTGGIIYRSAAMAQVMTLIGRVADSASSVLITGETGTGKELVARALHGEGGRKGGPFVAVNCSAISSSLMESELFGHVKGAFTGADREKKGLFAAADGGTLFLDEIGELPLELQPKLLRVLQEGEILRVGETRPRKVDVRVLAATARDLRDEVAKGRFRDDLFYRLAVVEVHIPPLRDRSEDIPLLAENFVRRIATREGRPVPQLQADALEVLRGYPWPGNVRELENFMEKTMIFCRSETIDLASLPWEVRRSNRNEAESLSLKQASMRLEGEYIRKALAATGGNRTQAARLLEISLRGLLYKMKEYGLE
ncbi:MAG TPA: sigma-54 dependent transcriptional regulator [Desulfuromonadales bacterium]|nr:sigma-54 dependent transcriptional regulator [Desulfuromonadales bacterium]